MSALPSLSPVDTDAPAKNRAASAIDLPAMGAGLTAFALLCVIAYPMLVWWRIAYTGSESYYGHAPLIPLLVALMLWHRRADLRDTPVRSCWAALLLTLASLCLLVFAVKREMQAVQSLSFLLCLLGGIWFALGTRWMRVAIVPLLFLFAMAPLPGPVLNDMTLGMQGLSTKMASGMLGMAGFHPHADGNLITLENYTLNVDVPCSGFKLLLRLLTFSAACAYLFEATLLRRWAIFLFSLPLSLFINGLRIALIGVVGDCLGPEKAASFHDWSGLITTIACMAILFGFARSLGCRRFAGQPIF